MRFWLPEFLELSPVRHYMTAALALILVGYSQIGWRAISLRAAPALAVTISFALIAWGLRSVTTSGALAGALVTFFVFIPMGMPGFIAILIVFVLTYVSTHFGQAQKERLGIVQTGGRSASQVLANLAAAAICCAPVIWFPNSRAILFLGACAALAEAAADTVSSEIGQALRSPAYLITDLSQVGAGRNGAISIVGTIAGIFSAALVAFSCVWMNLVSLRWFGLIFLAGTLGMLFDSLLGATLERPGRLGNDAVNFVSTVFAAFVAILTAFLLY
jgi:uncharacterized protein (TIGR00297 family)